MGNCREPPGRAQELVEGILSPWSRLHSPTTVSQVSDLDHRLHPGEAVLPQAITSSGEGTGTMRTLVANRHLRT